MRPTSSSIPSLSPSVWCGSQNSWAATTSSREPIAGLPRDRSIAECIPPSCGRNSKRWPRAPASRPRSCGPEEIAMTDTTVASPNVSASDTIRTIGILHFTIGVRDHIAAAKFYSQLLGCKHLRSSERYSFMQCGESYFVLAKMPHHVNPNRPGEDAHHHAFIVEPPEFD